MICLRSTIPRLDRERSTLTFAIGASWYFSRSAGESGQATTLLLHYYASQRQSRSRFRRDLQGAVDSRFETTGHGFRAPGTAEESPFKIEQ